MPVGSSKQMGKAVRGLSHANTRGDTRPNAKARRVHRKREAEVQIASDIRVVKKQKGDRVERTIDTSGGALKETEDQKAVKKIKALNKKLSAIEALIEKQKAGETLDEKQLAKIESLGETLECLDIFISQNSEEDDADDHDDDDDDDDEEEGGDESREKR